jgi:hypothetical protein
LVDEAIGVKVGVVAGEAAARGGILFTIAPTVGFRAAGTRTGKVVAPISLAIGEIVGVGTVGATTTLRSTTTGTGGEVAASDTESLGGLRTSVKVGFLVTKALARFERVTAEADLVRGIIDESGQGGLESGGTELITAWKIELLGDLVAARIIFWQIAESFAGEKSAATELALGSLENVSEAFLR